MGNPKKRSAASRQVRRHVDKRHARAPPPPPFLCLRRGRVHAPEPATLDVSVRVPLQQLRNREAVNDVVLRAVLHRLHATSSSSPSGQDTEKVTHRSVVHVDSVVIHADSARQAGHTGDVQLRATASVVLARVEHGLLVGVAESSQFTDTMVVRLHHPNQNNNNNNNSNSNSGDSGLLVTARSLEEEPVAAGQTVLLVSEPGTLRCLAIRPPRDAPGPFRVNAANGEAEIEACWPAKGKAGREDVGTA